MARDWFGDGSLYVVDLALACCALESQAAAEQRPIAEIPAGASVAVTVSGTITHAITPALNEALSALPTKPVVVAFGACACAGGPYWDSYSVVPGAQALGWGVDHFVAGCPPPPGALTAVLEEVRGAGLRTG